MLTAASSENGGAKHDQGFTLVELMVVVVIIGILIAMVVVNAFDQTATQRHQNMAMKIGTVIQTANQAAGGMGAASGFPLTFKLFDVPSGSGDYVLVGAFEWNDINDDRIVNWVDANGDGRLQDGEGEIVTVHENVRIDVDRSLGGRRPTNYQLRVGPISGLTGVGAGTLCVNGVYGGRDPHIFLFARNSGVLFGADEMPCTARFHLVDTTPGLNDPTVSFIVPPTGMIQIRGDGGLVL